MKNSRLRVVLIALWLATPAGAAPPTRPAAAPPSKATATLPAGAAPAPVAPGAGARVAVTLPAGAAYWVWASRPEGGSVLLPPQNVTSGSVVLDLPPASGPAVVHILDAVHQTEARRAITLHTGAVPAVAVAASDLTSVAHMPVRVVSGGRPVSSASVQMTDSTGHVAHRLLLPGDGGQAVFEDVPAGKATVRVQYAGDRSASQDFTVDPSIAPASRGVDVAVVGPVATEAVPAPTRPAPAPTKGAPAAEPSSGTSPWGGILFALVFMGTLAALIWHAARSGWLPLEDWLRRAGLSIPSAEPAPVPANGTSPPPPLVPEGTCPFCGTKKDPTTGACACAPASGPVAAVSGSGPRLVGIAGATTGQVISLLSDATLGRDADNTVVLAGDTTASRRHARVLRDAGGFAVADEGSANGTFVNGARVTRVALKAGDELTIGQSRFRFEV